MLEYYEFATDLRKLLQRTDKFGYDLKTLKEEVLYLAEAKEKYAEHMELQMIVNDRINSSNPSYDCGL